MKCARWVELSVVFYRQRNLQNWVSFLQKKQINPVWSWIGLPRSLLTINTWYKMINLLPCLIYDFNQLFQFNWNTFFKHILDGHKLNFKSINSKINWPQFFCNNSFTKEKSKQVVKELLQKNGWKQVKVQCMLLCSNGP